MVDGNEILFYFTALNFSEIQKEKFNSLLPILTKAYQQICFDKTNPTNREKLIKACILCMKMNDPTTHWLSLEVKEQFMSRLVSTTKSNLNWNFKETNRWMDLIKFTKDLLNNSKGEELLSVPLEIFENYATSKEWYRKLNQWFNSILDFTSEGFYNYKKLIWAMFINLSNKALINRTNIFERLKILVSVFIDITMLIPNEHFPWRYKVNSSNKLELIQSHVKARLHNIDLNNNIDEFIVKEKKNLPQGLVFEVNDKKNITRLIEYYYGEYSEKYTAVNKLDERWWLCKWYQNTSMSPMKSILPINKEITCSRKLSFEAPLPLPLNSLKKSITNLSNTNRMTASTWMDMTPCTRVISLNKWFIDYIHNFNITWVDELQIKYPRPLYQFNPTLIPISTYVMNSISKFKNISDIYNRIVTAKYIEDKTKLCLKFLNTWIISENVLFVESFNTKLWYSEDFVNAIIAWSFEICCLLEEDQEIAFTKILEKTGVDIYDLWKLWNPFNIKYSLSIKPAIREHIEEIEYQIISFLMWKDPSSKFLGDWDKFFKADNPCNSTNNNSDGVNHWAEFEFNQQSLFMFHNKEDYENGEYTQNITQGPYYSIYPYVKNYPNLEVISIFLRRVINYCICLNKAIFDKLDLGERFHELAMKSEALIKEIVSSENIRIIYGRHLDQIVLSSIMTVLVMCNAMKMNNKKYGIEEPETPWTQGNKIEIEWWFDTYVLTKTGQTQQTSNLILNYVKAENNRKDKSFVDLEEFFHKHFLAQIQQILNQPSFRNLLDESLDTNTDRNRNHNDDASIYTNPNANKRRKLSHDINDINNARGHEQMNNSNKESLTCKSAYATKMVYYTPLKKFEIARESKPNLGFNNWNIEKIPQRSVKWKDIYCNIINLQIENVSTKPKNNYYVALKLKNTRIDLFNDKEQICDKSPRWTPTFKVNCIEDDNGINGAKE